MIGGVINYIVSNDNFKAEDDTFFCFPCCCCVHRHGAENEEPCSSLEYAAKACGLATYDYGDKLFSSIWNPLTNSADCAAMCAKTG